MSQEERDKLEWLKQAKDKVIRQREAAERIGISERWVRKLLRRMKEQGDRVVLHGLRGRVSNRKIAAKVQAQAMEILKQPDWHDSGPTFASEQLAKRHGIAVSDETMRRWMVQAGLWKSKGAPAGRGPCLASAAMRVRRTGAMGHFRARLARRTWASALSGADDG